MGFSKLWASVLLALRAVSAHAGLSWSEFKPDPNHARPSYSLAKLANGTQLTLERSKDGKYEIVAQTIQGKKVSFPQLEKIAPHQDLTIQINKDESVLVTPRLESKSGTLKERSWLFTQDLDWVHLPEDMSHLEGYEMRSFKMGNEHFVAFSPSPSTELPAQTLLVRTRDGLGHVFPFRADLQSAELDDGGHIHFKDTQGSVQKSVPLSFFDDEIAWLKRESPGQRLQSPAQKGAFASFTTPERKASWHLFNISKRGQLDPMYLMGSEWKTMLALNLQEDPKTGTRQLVSSASDPVGAMFPRMKPFSPGMKFSPGTELEYWRGLFRHNQDIGFIRPAEATTDHGWVVTRQGEVARLPFDPKHMQDYDFKIIEHHGNRFLTLVPTINEARETIVMRLEKGSQWHGETRFQRIPYGVVLSDLKVDEVGRLNLKSIDGRSREHVQITDFELETDLKALPAPKGLVGCLQQQMQTAFKLKVPSNKEPVRIKK